VLSIDEVSSLIKTCPSDLLGHLWLCLCMGLRVAEASRVQHLTVTETHLVVGAEASKTKSRRVLDILRGHQKYSRLIRPQVNLRKRMECLRAEAGLSRWPRNCMRHTAASHWLNKLQSADATALHLGNSPVMLHRHYKALVTRKESEEFFELWRWLSLMRFCLYFMNPSPVYHRWHGAESSQRCITLFAAFQRFTTATKQ